MSEVSVACCVCRHKAEAKVEAGVWELLATILKLDTGTVMVGEWQQLCGQCLHAGG